MSNRANPKLKNFARRLLAHEARFSKAAPGTRSAAFRVGEKLRRTLGTLMGTGGVRALFSRSLAMARNDVSWLQGLEVKENGSFQGLDEAEAKLKEDEIALGEVALVTHVLQLLVTFIGPSMTLNLIQSLWPKADFDDSDFDE
jgi:hypothetical protein